VVTRDEAWALLCEWTPGDALRRHARSVELSMRAAAYRYGSGAADEDAYGLAGLLHDADYERWPEEHPKRIVAWLEERGEAEVAHAVSAHFTQWGVPYESMLDKALLACDELTGFIGACCHVRPGGLATLQAKSVRKKLKSKGFAAKVDRHEVHEGVRLLDVELADHVTFLIEALRPHAAEIGFGGPAG
jgi:predicted hydrolase (HD superfamily)